MRLPRHRANEPEALTCRAGNPLQVLEIHTRIAALEQYQLTMRLDRSGFCSDGQALPFHVLCALTIATM
ncbi:hypothetical protein B0G82_6310 [Paraburkholderia sp. BL17N1]|nr:hypothetical protein B0G82_6310 [Paraburkholderia sp. BL17N1]